MRITDPELQQILRDGNFTTVAAVELFVNSCVYDTNQQKYICTPYPLRLNTSQYTIYFKGLDNVENEYVGAGKFSKISAFATENTGLETHTIEATLSGIDKTLVSEALNTQYQGRRGILYTVIVREHDLKALYVIPTFVGTMDQMRIATNNETATISVTIVSPNILIDVASNLQYSNASQQRMYLGDRGLEFVDSIETKVIKWGRE